jgi:signal transduction histidine kinase
MGLVVVLCYMPFIRKLTKPLSNVATGILVIFGVYVLLVSVFRVLDLENFADIIATLFVLVSFFYFSKTVSEDKQKRNFIFCIGIYAGGMAHGIENIMYVLQILGYYGDFNSTQLLLIGIAVRVVAYAIVGVILYCVIARHMQGVKSEDMNYLWVIPFLFSIMTYFYTVGNNIIGIVDYAFPIVFIMLSVISFIVFIMLIRMLERAGINARLEMDIAVAEEQRLRLETENAAIASEKRFKEDILATISHEVRTPLAVMSVYAQMAVKQMNKGNITEQTMTDLNTISNEAKRLAELATDALTMFGGKTDINKRTHVDIGAAVTQLAGLLTSAAKNKNIEIKIELADIPPVWGVSDELTRVLWNLFDNAIKHTKNGVITVNGAYSVTGELKMENGELKGKDFSNSQFSTLNSQFVSVSIQDTGEGMTAETLHRAFEHGYSASGGPGMGLAFCKEIIENHGGSINIKSSIGNGCAVTFTLPISDNEIYQNDGNTRGGEATHE